MSSILITKILKSIQPLKQLYGIKYLCRLKIFIIVHFIYSEKGNFDVFVDKPKCLESLDTPL